MIVLFPYINQIEMQWITTVASVLLLITVVIAVFQLYESKRMTKAQIAVGLYQLLRSNDAIGILRNSIYKFRRPPSYETICFLDKQERDNITSIIDNLDMLGVLVNQGVIDEKLAIEGYAGASVLRCWYQMHKYVKYEQRYGRGSNVYSHFEDLAARTLKYAKTRHKEPYWICFHQYGKSVNERFDLVEELSDITVRPQRLNKQGFV